MCFWFFEKKYFHWWKKFRVSRFCLRSLTSSRIKRIPNHPCFCLLCQLLHEFIVNPFLNKNTRTRHAYFTLQTKNNELRSLFKHFLCEHKSRVHSVESKFHGKQNESYSALLYRIPKSARSVAFSTSASSKIIRGDFPPSSSETAFKLLVAAACITRRPTSVDPVKLTYKNGNLDT